MHVYAGACEPMASEGSNHIYTQIRTYTYMNALLQTYTRTLTITYIYTHTYADTHMHALIKLERGTHRAGSDEASRALGGASHSGTHQRCAVMQAHHVGISLSCVMACDA